VERFANFVYDRAGLIIIATILLNVVALASVFRVELDTDFMRVFSQGNPKSATYNDLNDKYQNGEPVSILIESDSPLLSKESLLEVSRIHEEIRSIPGVSSVDGFLPSEVVQRGEFVTVDEGFITHNHDFLVDFVENRYYLAEQSLSTDGRKGILTASLSSQTPVGEVIRSLRALVAEEEGFQMSLAGDAVIRDTLRHSIITVLLYLPPFAVLLILLVFVAVIRSVRLSILAMTPAGIAIFWTYGTILWSGQKLDVVTSAAPLFILVLGTAYGLHYVSHLNDNLRHTYSDRRRLTVETMRMVGTPIFLATVTTMVGFASLTWTEVLPIRNLGLFAAIGVGYAGLLALVFLPALLSRVSLPSKGQETRQNRLSWGVIVASRQRALIVVFFVAVVGGSAFYIPKIEIVSDQLMWFKEGSETRKIYDTVAEQFGGAFPLTGEIVSAQGQAALMDNEFAEDVLALERELEAQPNVRSAFSIFDLVRAFNTMLTGQDAYPQDPATLQEFSPRMGGEDLTAWIAPDGFRMMVRTGELGPEDIENLEGFVDDHSEIRALTGMPVLFDEMNTLVTRSQVRSLGLAFALIFIVLLVTLRKWRAALAGLLPIVITVVGIMGFLAISGTNLNIVTAVLSAICIGVGVDYCIHIITAIYFFRERGQSNRQSVTSALSVVSGPVLANALGITLGISVLFFAPLKLYTDAAAVVCLAMILSSMGALLLVPIFYSARGGTGPKRVQLAAEAAETVADDRLPAMSGVQRD
jgi:predicted RND superfamily exporter protein